MASACGLVDTVGQGASGDSRVLCRDTRVYSAVTIAWARDSARRWVNHKLGELLLQPGRFVVEDVPLFDPGRHQAEGRMERFGFFPSEVLTYHGIGTTKPLIVLGHASAVTVHLLGKAC